MFFCYHYSLLAIKDSKMISPVFVPLLYKTIDLTLLMSEEDKGESVGSDESPEKVMYLEN